MSDTTAGTPAVSANGATVLTGCTTGRCWSLRNARARTRMLSVPISASRA
ncbi:MAG: hypothetical protein IT359_18365 [Gemmatimonadaceae bacterium]|nr:hypothetical protein [Gemmatimonadaceae bacterium]